EQLLLWTSPAARRRLTRLWDSQRAAQYLAWQRTGIAPQIAYLAAADPAVQPITIDTHPHFTIKLYPLDADGQLWTVYLTFRTPSDSDACIFQGHFSYGLRNPYETQ